MKMSINDIPFPYVEIENVFKQKAYDEILHELTWLEKGNIFGGPERTGTARHQDGTIKKKNRGIFLNQIYADVTLSKIWKHVNDFMPYIFNIQSWYFDILKQMPMQPQPLISYYEESDYYESHADHSVYTFLFWAWKEPKTFTGGNLKFTDYDIEIECKPNSAVIFPGPINHEVLPINMEEENKGKGMGRFAVSNFLAPMPAQPRPM